MFKKHVINERGSTLAVVLMSLLVLTVLGFTLLGMTVSNVKTSTVEREFQSVYYIAEAGAHYKLSEVKSEVMGLYLSAADEADFYVQLENYLNIPTASPSFDTVYGHTPIADIEVETIEQGKYRLKSEGVIGERSRSVEMIFDINWLEEVVNPSFINDMAVFANGSISVQGNNAKIYGPVGTNNGPLNLHNQNSVTGTIYVGPDATGVSGYETTELDEERIYELPEFPNFPNDLPIRTSINSSSPPTITEDGYYDQIRVTGGGVLNINVNTDRVIRVRNLNLQNGHITLLGSGKLTLYIEEQISMGSHNVINTGQDIERLNVYYEGTSAINMNGGQKVYGSLYAKVANIKFAGGSGFQGHIISGGSSVELGGNSTTFVQVVYAPLAHVEIDGNTSVYGSIIADTFVAKGSSELIFEEPENTELPFFPPAEPTTPTIEDLLQSRPIREM